MVYDNHYSIPSSHLEWFLSLYSTDCISFTSQLNYNKNTFFLYQKIFLPRHLLYHKKTFLDAVESL